MLQDKPSSRPNTANAAVVDSNDFNRESLGLTPRNRVQQYQQQQSSDDMIKEQDIVLGELESHLTVIGTQSETIHSQVNEQLRDLNDLESGMERGARNIDNVYFRTKNLVEKSGGPSPIFVIICLSITAIVLLMLVIYT